MLAILEFLTSFYWPLLPETLFGTLRRANWRRAIGRYGPAGLLVETAESLIGTNTYVFFVLLYGRWDGRSIAQLLAAYGIDIWGWGFWQHEFFFHVRREDARQAQQIMLAAGIELLG